MSSLPSPPVARSLLAQLWNQFWRISLAVGLGLFAWGFIYLDAMDVVGIDGPEAPALTVVMLADVGLGAIAIVLYALRGVARLPFTVAIALLSSVSFFSAGAVVLSIVSIATRRRWKEASLISILFIGASTFGDQVNPFVESPPLGESVLTAIVGTGICVLIGLYIGSRRQLLETLTSQAASARREQQAKIEQAHANERARIAREMHDVLAHRLSLVALHAGALEYRTDLAPELVSLTAGVMRSNAHLALTELREVLGVLNETTEVASQEPLLPQQTVGDIPRLIEECNIAGGDTSVVVDRAITDSLDSLSEVQSRHLYRVVQEGLTNARKHSPGAPVKVRLSGEPQIRITATVSNPKSAVSLSDSAESRVQDRPPPSGFGIAGLRERVRLAGGELSVIDEEDAFTLQVWVPWNK